MKIYNRFTERLIFEGELKDLSRADLSRADLSGADLREANLHGAYLYGADLSRADLSGADLSRADLSGANLYGADLSGANLYGADLNGAYLSGANLYGADLSDANLHGAYLSDANLHGADLREAKIDNLQFVPSGTIIVYKKLQNGIATLEIPENAKRSNSTSRKCRAEFAKVLKIEDYDGNEIKTGISQYNSNFEYNVDEVVYPDSWDNNWWSECSNGIHFFLTKEEAENY